MKKRYLVFFIRHRQAGDTDKGKKLHARRPGTRPAPDLTFQRDKAPSSVANDARGEQAHPQQQGGEGSLRRPHKAMKLVVLELEGGRCSHDYCLLLHLLRAPSRQWPCTNGIL